MPILRILIFCQKVNAIGFAFLQKYANYNNSYFWTKRKAIGFAFCKNMPILRILFCQKVSL